MGTLVTSSLTLSCRMTYIYIYISYRTANLQMLHFIYYSTNIRTEYFKHAAHSPFFSLQNAVYFIMLPFLVPVLFTFYIQCVLKFKKNSGAKGLISEASFHSKLFVCVFLKQECWKLVPGERINSIIYSLKRIWVTKTLILYEKQKAAKDWSVFSFKQNVWI